MYNLNGEPMNENTYSSPTGGTNGSYTYNPQNSTNGSYTYNAAPNSPYPMNHPQGPKKSGVCGILGLIFSILAFPIGLLIPFLGILLAIAGIVLSIIGCNKQRAARGTGIAGLIISIIALIALIILIIVRTITLVNDLKDTADAFSNALENTEDDFDDTDTDADHNDSSSTDSYAVSHSWDEDYSEIIDIDDVTLLANSNVRITATQLIYETIGDTIYPYINITIENLSSREFSVDTTYCAVNGVVMTGYILEDVAPGQTLETDLSFDSHEFAMAGFTSIHSLAYIMELYDTETYDTLYIDDAPQQFVFDNSSSDFTISDLTSEAPVFSDADCDIYYLGTTDEYNDGIPDFLFFIDNRSAEKVCILLDSLYLNGEMQGALDIEDVYEKTGAFFTLEADEAVSVDSITDAKMMVEISDSDYNTLVYKEISFLP